MIKSDRGNSPSVSCDCGGTASRSGAEFPETIYALSSGGLPSAIAVVRLSGSQSHAIVESLMGQKAPSLCRATRRATLCLLTNPQTQQVIDQAVVIAYAPGASYTGEAMVELNLHGSIAAIEALFAYFSEQPGLRPAQAGEFTRRAFDYGRMDLTEVEAVSDLIAAETELQLKQALGQLEGHLTQCIEGLRVDLIQASALVEAGLDFYDEDLPEDLQDQALVLIARALDKIAQQLDGARRGDLLRKGIELALVGAPNSGKSTLFNWLAQQNLAIVSPQAGTTRDIVRSHINIAGYPVTLLDTAGLRDSRDLIEQEGVRRSVAAVSQARIILILSAVDSAGAETNSWNEKDIAPYLTDDKICIRVNSKCDLGLLENRSGKDDLSDIALSVHTGYGLDSLMALLARRLERFLPQDNFSFITRTRHRDGLKACQESLEGFAQQKDIVLRAEMIRRALDCLGRVSGRIEVEEVLDRIFADFCIGK